jgi:protein-disulfide isomerase
MNYVRDRLLIPISGSDHIRDVEHCMVVLVEYGDYQCPDSGTAHKIIQTLQQQLSDPFCFVFRHFPQAQKYSQAQKAAEAAEAAAAQGQFWQMHDVLFEHQHALDDSSLVKYADELKLDVPRFLRDMSGHVYAHRIKHDVESGRNNGILHTPTMFINNICYRDEWNVEALQAAISKVRQQ